MRIRQAIAMAYGLTAAIVAICVMPVTGMANADRTPRAIETMLQGAGPAEYEVPGFVEIPLEEIEPALTGHAEEDDLPAYLSGAPVDAWDIA